MVLSDHPSIHQPVISPGKHLKRREQKHYVCQPRVSRLSDSFTPESFVTRSTRFTFRQSEFPGRTIVSSLVAGGCGCTPLSSDVTTRLCSFRSLCKRGGGDGGIVDSQPLRLMKNNSWERVVNDTCGWLGCGRS